MSIAEGAGQKPLLKKQKILITGSSGLLGSALVKSLEPYNEILKGDRDGSVPKGTDYVIDCAAYGNRSSQDDTNEILNANVSRFNKLIRNSIENKVKGLIATSSSSVELTVQTVYSATKIIMENILIDHQKQLKGAIVRPFTVYGPGDKNHLIPLVFDSCLKGKVIYLNPEATHDYIYIDDAVSGYLDVLNDLDKFKSGTYDLGTGVATTNAEVVLRIERITGKKANIFDFTEGKDYDNSNWRSLSPGSGYLSLQEGLEKIYADIKQGLEKTYH